MVTPEDRTDSIVLIHPRHPRPAATMWPAGPVPGSAGRPAATPHRQEEKAVATIDDVARAAGVSRSTVSYALSGKRSISPATRDRIDRAIKQLKYTPNAGARSLRTAQT